MRDDAHLAAALDERLRRRAADLDQVDLLTEARPANKMRIRKFGEGRARCSQPASNPG